MKRSVISEEARRRGEELVRIGNQGVKAAQEENRRLGIPNVYSVDGILHYELLDGTLSQANPMIDYRTLDPTSGPIVAENHKRRIKLGLRYAVVLHIQRNSTADGEHHQIALDVLSDSSKFIDASPECQMIIERVFSDKL